MRLSIDSYGAVKLTPTEVGEFDSFPGEIVLVRGEDGSYSGTVLPVKAAAAEKKKDSR